jgi:hypothetical protein
MSRPLFSFLLLASFTPAWATTSCEEHLLKFRGTLQTVEAAYGEQSEAELEKTITELEELEKQIDLQIAANKKEIAAAEKLHAQTFDWMQRLNPFDAARSRSSAKVASLKATRQGLLEERLRSEGLRETLQLWLETPPILRSFKRLEGPLYTVNGEVIASLATLEGIEVEKRNRERFLTIDQSLENVHAETPAILAAAMDHAQSADMNALDHYNAAKRVLEGSVQPEVSALVAAGSIISGKTDETSLQHFQSIEQIYGYKYSREAIAILALAETVRPSDGQLLQIFRVFQERFPINLSGEGLAIIAVGIYFSGTPLEKGLELVARVRDELYGRSGIVIAGVASAIMIGKLDEAQTLDEFEILHDRTYGYVRADVGLLVAKLSRSEARAVLQCGVLAGSRRQRRRSRRTLW